MPSSPKPIFSDPTKDVHDELAAHIEMRRAELVADGVPEDQARILAERRFGNVTAIARECRDIDERHQRQGRRARMWTDLRQDVTYAFRLLRRSPGFTAVAIFTLALGIGGTTAIFSVIDAALIRPLPYPEPEQLVQVLVEKVRPDGRPSRYAPSLEDVRRWREDGKVVPHVTKWRSPFRGAILDGQEPERVGDYAVTEDYLGLFGVTPMLGRDFSAEDMRTGAEPVVLLGHAFWQRRFGGDPAIVGQTVRLDNQVTSVIGVLPPTFFARTAIWRPALGSPEASLRRGTGGVVYARLRPGVTIEQARGRLHQLASDTDPNVGTFDAIVIESLYDRETRGLRTTTDVLAAAVVAILLIACINVGGLLLARGATRGPELAVRAAVGAGRGRLVRQLLVESVTLAVIGGAAGALLAWISLDTLVANIPMTFPANVRPAINPPVLVFALAVSLMTGVVFGLVPALKLSRVNLHTAVLGAGRRYGSALSRRGGQVLIAAEVVVAIVLLAGAALMIRSFALVSSVDVGFDPDAIVTMEVSPVDQSQPSLQQFYPLLVEALRQLPSVEAVGAVDHLPLAGSSTVVGAELGGQRISMTIRSYLPGSFEALGLTLKAGRFSVPSDAAGTLRGAVLNERAAADYFGGDALGRTFVVGKMTYQVIGVVADIRHDGPLFPVAPEVFLPPAAGEPMVVVVRPRAGVTALQAELRQAAHAIGPRALVQRIRAGGDWWDDRIVTPRRRTVLLGLLGGLGFVLTLVGIFGTTAYAVGRRTHEIGVRMALGARPGEVVRTVLADSMWPVAIGVVAGLGAAALATRVIASFLFETPPVHFATFGAVAFVMAGAAAVAAWLPARRASKVEVTTALRTL